VLTDTVSVHDGTGWKPARSGEYFHVPEGGIHWFRNVEGEDASMLLLFAPGAPREEYFETLAHIADNPLSPEVRAEFMARHDTYWI
jgi:mannose-6-phosphate isomerase-like protein (cupin superfamily)